MIQIDKEKLRKIIEDAYENGWSGFLELKSEYASFVVESLKDHEDRNLSTTSSLTISSPTNSFDGYSVPSLIPGHYSYVGYNGGVFVNDTVFVNEPGEDVI